MHDIQTLKLTLAAVGNLASKIKDFFSPSTSSSTEQPKMSTTNTMELAVAPSTTSSTEKTKMSTITTTELAVADGYDPKDEHRLVKFLEEGSQAQTAIIRNLRTNCVLVAKHYYPVPKQRPDGTKHYLEPDEAKALLGLLGKKPHKNIVRAFAVAHSGLETGRHFLYLEYCSGGDLFDQIRHFCRVPKSVYSESGHAVTRDPAVQEGLRKYLELTHEGDVYCVPEVFILHVFISLVEALEFIHGGYGGKAVLHRDIKSENVLLRWPADEHGLPDVVLADFGLAELETECHGLAGTSGTYSPEVADLCRLKVTDRARELERQPRVMTQKSDIYQLGLLMCQLATYNNWKTGRDPVEVKLPGEYDSQTLRDLQRVLAWCLEVPVHSRPKAGELMDMLDMFQTRRAKLFAEHGALPRDVWSSPGRIESDKPKQAEETQRDSVMMMPAAIAEMEAMVCVMAL